MWDSVWLSFQKAFELMGANDRLLTEIVGTTMQMALQSTLYSFLIGMPIGILLATSKFKGKKVVVVILRTLMGLPPVAVGIFLYLLFSGIGPFGSLGLMYSVQLMVIAQCVLITPIVAGMTETALSPIASKMLETTKGLGFRKPKVMLLTMNEGIPQLFAVLLFAFARATAEVGAVQIVGGNILHKTRVMTTAISMNYNSGSFELAVALGIILVIIALAANVVGAILQFGLKRKKT